MDKRIYALEQDLKETQALQINVSKFTGDGRKFQSIQSYCDDVPTDLLSSL